MISKKPWLSKTILTNLLIAILAFFPGVSDFVASNPQIVIAFWSITNIVLRWISKDKIQLLK